MSILVVDASVVLKWFVPEVHSEVARRLLNEPHQLVAPDLIFAEIGNAIWKKTRLRQLRAEQAQQLIADVCKSAIETQPMRSLAPDAHAIAVATGRTVYDSRYVALAVRLQTHVITADERLANALAAIAMFASFSPTRFDAPRAAQWPS